MSKLTQAWSCPCSRNWEPHHMEAPTMPRLRTCLAGRRMGFPLREPRSLPNAMTDPVKVTPPINTPRRISISWINLSFPAMRACPGSRKLDKPTRTAAAPTKLCRMATSSGMEVISTRLARTAPITAPPSIKGMSNLKFSTCPLRKVARMARAIPKIPYRFPFRAVSCLESPPRLKTKRIPETRYAVVTSPSFIPCETS